MPLCSEDQFQCGSSCLDIGEYYDYDTYDYIQHDYNFYTSLYWSCDGECQDTSEQCHGECPEGWVYCSRISNKVLQDFGCRRDRAISHESVV